MAFLGTLFASTGDGTVSGEPDDAGYRLKDVEGNQHLMALAHRASLQQWAKGSRLMQGLLSRMGTRDPSDSMKEEFAKLNYATKFVLCRKRLEVRVSRRIYLCHTDSP